MKNWLVLILSIMVLGGCSKETVNVSDLYMTELDIKLEEDTANLGEMCGFFQIEQDEEFIPFTGIAMIPDSTKVGHLHIDKGNIIKLEIKSTEERTSSAEIKNCKYHGNTEIYESGELVKRDRYQDGVLHGKQEEFEEGKLLMRTFYFMGELERSELYFEDGKQIEWDQRFEFDERQDKRYYKNGNVRTFENYKEDPNCKDEKYCEFRLHGLQQEYDFNGNLIRAREYKYGELVDQIYPAKTMDKSDG